MMVHVEIIQHPLIGGSECSMYGYNKQQSTTGIDTQSTKVFLQKELDCVNRIMCSPTNSINIHNNRREITYNNNGGVYGEGWSFTVSADRLDVLGYINQILQ